MEKDAIAARLCLMGHTRRQAAAAVGLSRLHVDRILTREKQALLDDIRRIEPEIDGFSAGQPLLWSTVDSTVAWTCNRLVERVRSRCSGTATLANVTMYCQLRQAFAQMVIYCQSQPSMKRKSAEDLRRAFRHALREPTVDHLVSKWLGIGALATTDAMTWGYRIVLHAISMGVQEWTPTEILSVPETLPSYEGAWGNRAVNLANLILGTNPGESTHWDALDASRTILPGSEWSIREAWRTLSVLLPIAVMVATSTIEARLAVAGASLMQEPPELGLVDARDRHCLEFSVALGNEYNSGPERIQNCYLALRHWCDIETYSNTMDAVMMVVDRDEFGPDSFADGHAKARERANLIMNEVIPWLLPAGREMLHDPKVYNATEEPLTRFLKAHRCLAEAQKIATRWMREALDFYTASEGPDGAPAPLPSISPDLLNDVDLEW